MAQQNCLTTNDNGDTDFHLNFSNDSNNDENNNPDSLKPPSDHAAYKTIDQVHTTTKGGSHLHIGSGTSNSIGDSNTDDYDCRSTSHHKLTATIRPTIMKEICKEVIRCKLMRRRHLVIKEGINPAYLKEIMPTIVNNFQPQSVQYNGGVANITTWKISCYLEVMDHGIPTAQPNVLLQQHCLPLLNQCNDLFVFWYQQQHSCITKNSTTLTCRRLMTFITRYTPAPNEQALLKHIDGAGKVDGSVVVALPIDEWTAPYEINDFVGGGLTFWDGPKTIPQQPTTTSTDDDSSIATTPIMTNEIHYNTRSGDVAFIDRAVWHQADPITEGTRWALVIFYKIET